MIFFSVCHHYSRKALHKKLKARLLQTTVAFLKKRQYNNFFLYFKKKKTINSFVTLESKSLNKQTQNDDKKLFKNQQ